MGTGEGARGLEGGRKQGLCRAWARRKPTSKAKELESEVAAKAEGKSTWINPPVGTTGRGGTEAAGRECFGDGGGPYRPDESWFRELEARVWKAGGSAQSGDAELEQLKKLLYVPHVEGNPFPMRPSTLETDMPQMFDLYNAKTYDALSRHADSSMRYERLVLAPAISHMHGAIAYSEVTLDWCQDEKDPPTLEDLGPRIYAAYDTLRGIFSLLSNRYTILQLRASMESDTTSHGGAEALQAKLAFIEEKVRMRPAAPARAATVHGLGEAPKTRPNLPIGEVLDAFHPSGRPTERAHPAGRVRSTRGAWRPAGENSEAMQWISKGAKMRSVDTAPLPFDHGMSLGDATPPQLEGMAAENRAVSQNGRMGTSEEGTTRIPSVPVGEAGDEQVASSDGLPLVERALRQVPLQNEDSEEAASAR
ncbi:hypothetical protein CYMTET_53137 [Cymbomonas tetramitiformis]|uniref:Uncharacterized protein n=1 Tax=Cymbomonas tetramitiformis TaxID=36881 RepID=A0AAE0EQ21_9CHLO|nr:hypothetical protein CYMTET_53137 [Cymbomonas tetramitiformis]